MGRRRFLALLTGLSGDSVWRQRLKDEPVVLTGDAARAHLNRMK